MESFKVIHVSKILKVQVKNLAIVDLFGGGIIDAVAFVFEDKKIHFMVCSGLGRRDYCIIDDLGTIVMVSDGASTITYNDSSLIDRDWEILNRRVLIEKSGRI